MNRAALLIDGHRILPELLRDLAEARQSIHIAIFLFFRDPIGEEIARLLARKVAGGVKVRVLLNVEKTNLGDPFSTAEKAMMRHDPSVHYDPTDVAPLCKWMRQQGIDVIDTNIDYDHIIHCNARLTSIAAQIRDTIAVDDLHIDHRKIAVIDGCVGYCGGANVGAQYMYHLPFNPGRDAEIEGEERKQAGQAEPWWKWHDSLTRLEGPIVRDLECHFHDRWILDGGADYPAETPLEPPGRGDWIVHAEPLVNEPNDKPNQVTEKYLELIEAARESIFIENPYLYHPAIAEALVAAKRARPRLRVDLIMPCYQNNDNSFAQDAQQHAYSNYLEVGIGVHEYLHHFNHLKLAVFDGRYSIHGSTNLNYRSLERDKDFELNVFVDDVGLASRALREVRDEDLRWSKRFTLEDLRGLRGRFQVRTRDPRTLLLLSRKVL
jgi:cardiolipin synthase A/B